MTALLAAALALAAPPSLAAEGVDAGIVCRVQNAIRWREAAWTTAMCSKVANALNETPHPVQTFAQAINESDLRERAQRVTILPDGRLARDLGLMAVRCVTDPEARPSERDRCTNGAAKGLYANQLLDPAVNIRAGAAVLASHGGSLHGFNGCKETKHRKCTYGKRIAALVAALGGAQVKVRGPRIRKLTGQIIEALAGVARSKARSEDTIAR